jgi:hypothetical protein
VAGSNYQSGRNLTDPKTTPLEVTGTRVKMRQEAFFQRGNTGPVLEGVKGTGDYTVYPTGRMALHWVRRYTNTAPIDYTFQQLQTVTRFQAPFDTWLTYTDTGAIPPAKTTPPDAKHTFVLSQTEKPEARMDVLTILARDWARRRAPTPARTPPTRTWRTTGVPALERFPREATPATWDFPLPLQRTWSTTTTPRCLGRRDDYAAGRPIHHRGQPWNDPVELTSSDHFNEAEGAYLLTLDPDPGRD